MRATDKFWGEPKPNDSAAFKEFKKGPAETQAALARYLFENRWKVFKPVAGRGYWMAWDYRGFTIFRSLMRMNLAIETEELLGWMLELRKEYGRKRRRTGIGFEDWPVGYVVQQVERKSKKAPLSETAREQLQEMLAWPEMGEDRRYFGTDFSKVEARIRAMLEGDGADKPVEPYKKLSGDNFGSDVESRLADLSDEDAEKWHRVFHHADSADGARPTKKFRTATSALRDELGKEWFRRHLHDVLGAAVSAKPIEEEHVHEWRDFVERWVQVTVFTKSNVALLKGLVWMMDGFRDSKSVNLAADLCEKSTMKIPNHGPAAQATANACLWYLEQTPGMEAAARLSRLSTAIKQKSTQDRVRKIVEKKAEEAGMTTIQLEERSVPGYGLDGGVKTVAFDDFTLRIEVEGPGKVIQTWLKPDGSPQKTKPKCVSDKAALKARFDKVKGEVTALKKVLTAQRDRIDRIFAEEVSWPLADVESFYVQHPLVACIAARLIWALETSGVSTGAVFRAGGWEDVAGQPVRTDEGTEVRLWHPVDASTDEVMAWRTRLAELEISQPTKQAHREVYLLTDAERRTDVYSNRMAAHMLKQHQMATLMSARGWRYQLTGAFDDGLDNQFASKTFATSDLKAEYLIHTNWDDENWNDAGIFLYVGTDQLRFVDTEGAPVRLETVPTRLFSETMREADLFVGVASVGNDPAWFDQGPNPDARAYWHSYSFGDLDGFAETRKDVLESVLPRLKIRDVAHIDGKFLIVDGKLNTYKIHLGSSNILMEPGDRYLCIVPGGVSKSGQVMLPFEGDNRLSVIISKAMMLAEDDKIQVPDIKRQIKR